MRGVGGHLEVVKEKENESGGSGSEGEEDRMRAI